MFVDLVQLGEGTQDIKRCIPFERFRGAHGEHAKAVRDVLRRLQDHRLITTSDDGRLYEVVHEALIREWPRLRQWIDADRAGLRIQRELTEAAHQWEERDKDASYLYQGTRLAVACEWAETHAPELTPGEREFLDASLVEAIKVAETKDVPPLVKQLADHHLCEATKQLLDLIIMNYDKYSKEHLHASLALLPEDEGQVEYLYHRLLKAGSIELPVIRDALKQYQERLVQEKLVEQLWMVLEQPKDEGQYLQAASALALYNQSNPRWQKVGDKVAQAMVTVNVVDLSTWLNALRPARGELTAPLATISRNKEHPETVRSRAMNILDDYASDDPVLLADLLANRLMDSGEEQFAVLFDKLKTPQDLAGRPLEDELAKPSPEATEVDDQDVERKKDVLAERQARAAVALIRLGKAKEVWPLIRHSADPRLRSFLVNWLRPLGVDPRTLAAELDRLDPDCKPTPAQGQQVMDAILFHPQTSMRRALILALGRYSQERLLPKEREALIARLLGLYKTDPDAGIHGATEWTLRQWGQQESLKELDAELMKVKEWGDRRWFVNGQGQTFTVINGPIEFDMGSPPTEPERLESERLHKRVIPRCFAIATKEVTVKQYQDFLEQNPKIERLEIDKYSPEPTGPMNGMTWYEAAAYCNWLSEKEEIPKNQWCYLPNERWEYPDGMMIPADVLQRQGYRLPTDAEWEYACRAGTMTSRYYGPSIDLLGLYAWYLTNSQDHAWPGGSLLPNDLGLFDMLGNVLEWCQDRYERYGPGDKGSITKKPHRLLRGGSFNDPPSSVRSAGRLWDLPSDRVTNGGFRPARTYP